LSRGPLLRQRTYCRLSEKCFSKNDAVVKRRITPHMSPSIYRSSGAFVERKDLVPCRFQSLKSTSVFSVIGLRQFGHRAVSVSTKSNLPCFPVTSASAQSNGISASSGWQCSQDSIRASALRIVSASTVMTSMPEGRGVRRRQSHSAMSIHPPTRHNAGYSACRPWSSL